MMSGHSSASAGPLDDIGAEVDDIVITVDVHHRRRVGSEPGFDPCFERRGFPLASQRRGNIASRRPSR
jgi:hypothetical protein